MGPVTKSHTAPSGRQARRRRRVKRRRAKKAGARLHGEFLPDAEQPPPPPPPLPDPVSPPRGASARQRAPAARAAGAAGRAAARRNRGARRSVDAREAQLDPRRDERSAKLVAYRGGILRQRGRQAAAASSRSTDAATEAEGLGGGLPARIELACELQNHVPSARGGGTRERRGERLLDRRAPRLWDQARSERPFSSRPPPRSHRRKSRRLATFRYVSFRHAAASIPGASTTSSSRK